MVGDGVEKEFCTGCNVFAAIYHKLIATKPYLYFMTESLFLSPTFPYLLYGTVIMYSL